MAASKRKDASSSSSAPSKTDAHDEDEKALDPKLAEHPDKDEDETSKPPTKRQKPSPTKPDSRSAVINGSSRLASQYGSSAYAKSGEGWHRSDFNPAPKGRSDSKTPLNELEAALKAHAPSKADDVADGKNVVYWMRMHDLRVHDNRAPRQVLDNFMRGQGGETALDRPANEPSTTDVGGNAKDSRLGRYAEGRNLLNENGTSCISPYLAAGLVSARECLRRTKALTNNRLTVGRDSGAAMWNTEISFRDFYGHVLAAWPKVCMGHAFITKYEDVVWETDAATLDAWKQGKTGYPIVDAAQRQCIQQGYIHNRGRMISAMFLTKHLLHDWREGERHFSLNFIDQDFASNNGGWQWSASTGTDPQPYFRIFSPLSQSEKSDPQGDYIRHFVPELKNVKGNAIHDPFHRLSKAEFEKLGYPKPIVEHAEARQRALRRYKNPGDK